jgi:hypothetical protein
LAKSHFHLIQGLDGLIVYLAGPFNFSVFAIFLDEVIRGVFAMMDERRRHAPTPHLRTRPATMITAIGLCIIIMLFQFVPDLQRTGPRLSGSTVASVR